MIATTGNRDVFDLSQLRALFGPESDGASLLRLHRNAESLGYTVFISTLDWDGLRRERRPVVTRIVNRNSCDDYVMIQAVFGDEVVMVDGELRVKRLSRSDFIRLWTGWVVILQRCLRSAGA